MTKKDKAERPWLNLQVDGRSVLRCKNAELIEEKIINDLIKGGGAALEIRIVDIKFKLKEGQRH